MVTLSNAHIIIEKHIAESIFLNLAHVNWVYYPRRAALLIAPATDEIFKSLHKTAMSVLKYRNKHGDRSISIRELLLDNEIDSSDRNLGYLADEKMKILNIYFGSNSCGVLLP